MTAINQGGTFYRLDESSQSGDCGEANVMALHLASKQVMLTLGVMSLPAYPLDGFSCIQGEQA